MKLGIQGIGVIGGFGCGTEALRGALNSQESRKQSAPVKTTQGLCQMPALLADTSRLEDFVNKKALRRVDHYSKMALLGACLALQDAGQLEGDHPRMGLVIATGYGASRTTFAFLDSFILGGDHFSSPTHFSNSVHNAAVANVSILLGITGLGLTVSQFEMSVPSALFTVRNWLKEGRVDSVLFGGIDEYCDVLGYCWQRFFGEPEEAGGGMTPFEFHLQSAIPGEGAAFFLLTRAEEEDKPAPYGYIEEIMMGRCGRGGKLALPGEAIWFIGADGHKKCGSYYKRYLPENAPLACYTPVYGSLPIGPAFDMAIAGLSMKEGKFLGSPRCFLNSSLLKGMIAGQTADKFRIGCLKIGALGELGLITLTKG